MSAVLLEMALVSCVASPPGPARLQTEPRTGAPVPASLALSVSASTAESDAALAPATATADSGAPTPTRGPWHVIAQADNRTQFSRFPVTGGALWLAGRWATPWLGVYDVEVALETERGLVSIPDFTAGLPPLVQVNLLHEPDGLWVASQWNAPSYFSRCFRPRWLNGWRVLSGIYGSYPNGLWATVNRFHNHASAVTSVYRRVGGRWLLQKAYRALGDVVVAGIPWKGGLLVVLQGYGRRARFDLIGGRGPAPRFDASPFSFSGLFADPAGALFAIVCDDGCQLMAWAPGASEARSVDLPSLRPNAETAEFRFPDRGLVALAGPTWSDRLPSLGEEGAKRTRVVVKLEEQSVTIVEQTELPAAPPGLPAGFEPGQLQTAADGTWFVSGRPYVDGVMTAVVVSERSLPQVWRPQLPSISGRNLPVDRNCLAYGELP